MKIRPRARVAVLILPLVACGETVSASRARDATTEPGGTGGAGGARDVPLDAGGGSLSPADLGGTTTGADAALARAPDATELAEPDAEAPAPDGAVDPPPGPDGAVEPPPAPGCPEPVLDEVSEWRHRFVSPATVSLGVPQHSAVEPIVNPGTPLAVAGKFAYGAISKDLEDEDVELFVRLPGAGVCGDWRSVGVATTDSDGRASVVVDAALVPESGHYDFRLVVQGDHTDARGALWVVEPGTAFVVFDVDGTLTIGDSELFEQVLLGQEPEMYEAADVIAHTYFEAGYQPLYMTGRPYFLNPSTRRWLIDRGFPPGPVRTTDEVGQALPTEGGVQTYKREYLLGILEGAGVEISYAYGNATTDICAYAQVGIDPANTFIIGPNAGGACDGFAATQAVADYPSHLPSLANLPPAPAP